MDVRLMICLLTVMFVGCVLMDEGHLLRAVDHRMIKSALSLQPDGCSCHKETKDCGCCAHIKFDALHVKVDDDVCANITYLSKQRGLSLTFAWNGKIIFNETVSAANPPPFCFGVPHLRILDICIKLYNISYDEEHFGGCMEIELDVIHIKKDFHLGCIYRNQLEAQSTYKPRNILKIRNILRRMFENKLQTAKRDATLKPLNSGWNMNNS